MTTLIVVGIIGLILILLGGYAIGVFNSLVQVRNNVDKAWENIHVLLMQRHDELPKLIDTCKAYMKHEDQVLTKLTKLRVGYDETDSSDEKVKLENQINKEMLGLRHVWEGYPDLKASQNFLQIQGRVSVLETSIADRREFFNDSINIYNIQIERFPEKVVAGLLSYRRRQFLEVPAEKTEDVEMAF